MTSAMRACAAVLAVLAAYIGLAVAVSSAHGAPTVRLLRHLPRLAPDRLLPVGPFHPVKGGGSYGEGGARFGANRGGRSHAGQDVFALAGTPLVAVRAARVVETGNDGGRGNYVALYSPQTRETYVYLHMIRPAAVHIGELVLAGQRVGAVGCTGSCWGDHLHFEIRRGRGPYGAAMDPLPRLRRWHRLG